MEWQWHPLDHMQMCISLQTGNQRKFYFANRVVDHWNFLPNWVATANNIKLFKKRLDQYWQHQDIIYDFRAQIQGTGNRSKVL